MKTVGKQVLFISTTEANPRNGETSMIRLKDGAILLAYTQYYAGDWNDHGAARLMACRSEDEGETWSEPFLLLDKDETAQNYMAPSLFRLKDGGLGMLWLRKNTAEGGMQCMPVFARSDDEGKTWSPYVFCVAEPGYYCGTNDSVVVLKSGRIMAPVSHVGHVDGCGAGVILFICSDDNGQTWFTLDRTVSSPYRDDVGLQEPGVYEQADGTLWAAFRTVYGFQYQSLSQDGGESWSPVLPNFRFSSPDSPMRVKKAGDRVIAVFNPVGYSCALPGRELWGSPKRTPLVCAVSEDDAASFIAPGETFRDGGFKAFEKKTYLLETDPENSYCYPSVCGVEGGFLVGYYHSNGGPVCLNSTKVVKVMFDELQSIEKETLL